MGEKTTSESQNRLDLIAAIKTPLSFFVLVVLVGEAGLIAFAAKAEGMHKTIGIIGMIVLLLASCAAVYFLANRGNTENTNFCRQIEGVWWEKINYTEGSAICFFSISYETMNSYIVLNGTSFGKDGEVNGTWQSEMTRLYPADHKIVYLWRGKHPLPGIAQNDFHGYGILAFQTANDAMDKLKQGRGDFWDVDQTNPRNTVLKPCEIRRVTDVNDMKIMLSGSSAEKRDVVLRVLSTW